jgi:hypothetical protein
MIDVTQCSSVGIDRYPFSCPPANDREIGHVGIGDSRHDDHASGC